MSRSIDRLYELLPRVHRQRDADRGHPLRSLLRVIGEQVAVVEAEIETLYDDWFIETCEPWVVPYIGDLIGYRPVHEGGAPGAGNGARSRILVPRRDVASTLGYRRRKGSLALLEELSMAVAGWPARAVEFYALLAHTQHANHVHPARGRSVDVRRGDVLDLLGGPFESTPHFVDVRRIDSHRSPGRYDIPSVGLFAFRLKAYSITRAPAYCLESGGPNCFLFNVLAHDTRLYTRAEAEPVPEHIAEEKNLPVPIRRRALEVRTAERSSETRASADYYGAGKSLAVYAPDWPSKGAPQPIPSERVIPADLSDFAYRAPRGHIGVDPVLGRIVFPSGQLPKNGVWVTYHYAFSADIGGGEYHRELVAPRAFARYRVEKSKRSEDTYQSVSAAIAAWREEQEGLGPEPAEALDREAWVTARERLRSAVVEILDSSAYSESLRIDLEAGESLQVRAADRKRPVIRMLDFIADEPDALRISGKAASRFTLDGVVISGRGLQIVGPDRGDEARFAEGDLCDVTLRHVTLVPGWGLECDCEPKRPNEPSLELFGTRARISVEHSILGSIEIVADEVTTDPVSIRVTDSVIDATSESSLAVGSSDLPLGFASLSIARSTVIGTVNVHAIELAENSIFTSQVRVARRQIGCVRFCYVPEGSRTPRRYRCQPDVVREAVDLAQPAVAEADRPAARARAASRVRPRFNSLRYGTPDYCQLASDCAPEITRGADDESEVGVFHDLFQPQREANLRARLDEYTPFGMEAGIVFGS